VANAVVDFDGQGAVATKLPAVGSFLNLVAFRVTISGTTTSEDIVIPGLNTIQGHIVQVLDSNGDSVTTDIRVTRSGNTLTLANGGATFNLDAASQVIYIIAWGI